jgi:predicted ATPase
MISSCSFIRSVVFSRERSGEQSKYPFSIPAVRALTIQRELSLDQTVTFLVGENGSGKSTLIEAIAILAGFNPEGGTRNFSFSTRRSESPLHRSLRLIRGPRRERTGYFFRGESYFNVATNIEDLDRDEVFGRPVIDSYGGHSLHEKSHGESFLSLILHRFGPDGLYILDEPEAALSPSAQLILLQRIHSLVTAGRSQFIIATHSPIVMAYPQAAIYLLADGIRSVRYEETEHFRLTRDFLLNRERFLDTLFAADEPVPVVPARRGRGRA